MNDIRPQIFRALESGSQDSRWAAALALEGYVHESWARVLLEELLDDRDSFIKGVAARALNRRSVGSDFMRVTSARPASKIARKVTSSELPHDVAKAFDYGSVRSMLEQHLGSEARLPIGRKIPQANSVDRVIAVARLLGRDGSINGASWQAEISSRQVLYYRDAALWLGLLDDSNDTLHYLGGELGIESGSLFERFSAISGALIRSHPVVQSALGSFLNDGMLPRISVFNTHLVELHRRTSVEGAAPMGPSTAKRRLDTARAWTQWITSKIPPGV